MALVFAALGFLILFSLVFRFRRRRPCRWRRDLSMKGPLWYCLTCGAESFALGSGAPQICKRAMKDKSL